MQHKEEKIKNGRRIVIIALSFMLIFCLAAGRIQSTASYMSAKSGACVNTFLVETSEEPTNPTEPTQPTDPSEPTDPTEPSEPIDPTEPTQPSDPTEPTEPTEPTQPSEPTDTSESTTPSVSDATDPSGGQDGLDDSNAKTGDTFGMSAWGTAALMSLIALVATVIYRPRNKKKGS